MAEPEPSGCVETFLQMFFGMALVGMIVLTLVVLL